MTNLPSLNQQTQVALGLAALILNGWTCPGLRESAEHRIQTIKQFLLRKISRRWHFYCNELIENEQVELWKRIYPPDIQVSTATLSTYNVVQHEIQYLQLYFVPEKNWTWCALRMTILHCQTFLLINCSFPPLAVVKWLNDNYDDMTCLDRPGFPDSPPLNYNNYKTLCWFSMKLQLFLFQIQHWYNISKPPKYFI